MYIAYPGHWLLTALFITYIDATSLTGTTAYVHWNPFTLHNIYVHTASHHQLNKGLVYTPCVPLCSEPLCLLHIYQTCDGDPDYTQEGHDPEPERVFTGVRYERTDGMKFCEFCAKEATQSPTDGSPPIVPDQIDDVTEIACWRRPAWWRCNILLELSSSLFTYYNIDLISIMQKMQNSCMM